MFDQYKSQLPDLDPNETSEWVEALEDVVDENGPSRARYLLRQVLKRSRELNVGVPALIQTPYINTIPLHEEPKFPGDPIMEKRIRRIVRWNAMAMVQRANKRFPGLGGHISSYASSASLYEVGFNHFFRGPQAHGGGDQIMIQGHAAPGIYARAFLEGRLPEAQLDSFRRETSGGGLSSYPHPWLMPDFWQFPTVSMGLGPISAIYQARFNRYLHNRGIKDTSENRVWAYLGDGECDEPETLGALSVAAREGLDNLTFVVNCNLQRLDGPVRGNGKVIQELEAVFRGAGWHVIKVIWGPEWDPLFAEDFDGALVQRCNEVVDGQFQKYSVEDGAYIRKDFGNGDPRIEKLLSMVPEDRLPKLRRGGHSQTKLYAAYHQAVNHQDAPVAILAKTVKGWTLGEGFEASNVTHQMKKLDIDHLKKFRDTLKLPISDDRLSEAPYYHPGKDSEEVQYMLERRHALGGSMPHRKPKAISLPSPEPKAFEEFNGGGKAGVEVSTTMAYVRLLRNLLRDKGIGKRVVPIIPDEGRTFGMDALFRDIGIYAALGQKYEPVDAQHFLYYRESKTGQILEEGITEAGSMASFQAAGTAYSSHGEMMIPFYTFYSMFGFQRTGDQIWQFGDARGRGFLMGATAGRTTLNGEGLQHEDGHSHLQALAFPNLRAYDPAYAYETAIIIKDGLKRMIEDDEDVFYYITLYNENYVMPALPEGAEEGIIKGLYRLPEGLKLPKRTKLEAHIFASGPMVQAAYEAQRVLFERYKVAAHLWSVTSYQQLFRDGRAAMRHNRLNPGADKQVPYVTSTLAKAKAKGPIVAVSDWVAELPNQIREYIPNQYLVLGTDGFGRSDTRDALRRHFEIDAASIVITVLSGLLEEGKIEASVVTDAIDFYDYDVAKPDPMTA